MSGDKINNAQMKAVYALVKKLKLDKVDLVSGTSNGRTEHLSDLSKAEANSLIMYLKSQDPDEKKAEKQRRKVIAIAHEMGWHYPGTHKVDMPRLDRWCKTYGKYKKKLNHHNLKELPQLITQFEQVRIDYLKSF